MVKKQKTHKTQKKTGFFYAWVLLGCFFFGWVFCCQPCFKNIFYLKNKKRIMDMERAYHSSDTRIFQILFWSSVSQLG